MSISFLVSELRTELGDLNALAHPSAFELHKIPYASFLLWQRSSIVYGLRLLPCSAIQEGSIALSSWYAAACGIEIGDMMRGTISAANQVVEATDVLFQLRPVESASRSSLETMAHLDTVETREILKRVFLKCHLHLGLVYPVCVLRRSYYCSVKRLSSLTDSGLCCISANSVVNYTVSTLPTEAFLLASSSVDASGGAMTLAEAQVLTYFQLALHSALSSSTTNEKTEEGERTDEAMSALTPAGVMLTGSEGSGKASIVRTVCRHLRIGLLEVDTHDILDDERIASADTLAQLTRQIIDDLRHAKPVVLFLRHLDKLSEEADRSVSDSVDKSVGRNAAEKWICDIIDMLPQGCFVVGSAVNRFAVPRSLLRSNRLMKEFAIPVPSFSDRFRILDNLCHEFDASAVNTAADAQAYQGILTAVADKTSGFTPAKLRQLFEAARSKHLTSSSSASSSAPSSVSSSVSSSASSSVPAAAGAVGSISCPSLADFLSALPRIGVNSLRGFDVKRPTVTWVDIAGYEEVKRKLRESAIWPWQHATAFQRLGVTPPCGVLLFGPPGTGKTLLAHALGSEPGAKFIEIRAPEMFSPYLGDSEKNIRSVFALARQSTPCILFIDEIDSLGTKRDTSSSNNGVQERVLSTLLNEMDGIEALHGVMIVVASNRPDLIDSALMRPGRIDAMIYVPLPDDDSRRAILSANIEKLPLDDTVDLNRLAIDLMRGLSGSAIAHICRESAFVALREVYPNVDNCHVGMKHFETAIRQERENRIISSIVDDSIYESFLQSRLKAQ